MGLEARLAERLFGDRGDRENALTSTSTSFHQFVTTSKILNAFFHDFPKAHIAHALTHIFQHLPMKSDPWIAVCMPNAARLFTTSHLDNHVYTPVDA